MFYEQYLTLLPEGLATLGLCLLPTFAICYLLLGMDLRSGLLNLFCILMILVDTVGFMALWGISYNAVSLINLVTVSGVGHAAPPGSSAACWPGHTAPQPSWLKPRSCPQAVGISVEFVSHITHSFAVSTKPTRLERAKEATISMGSAVSRELCHSKPWAGCHTPA